MKCGIYKAELEGWVGKRVSNVEEENGSSYGSLGAQIATRLTVESGRTAKVCALPMNVPVDEILDLSPIEIVKSKLGGHMPRLAPPCQHRRVMAPFQL
jgi:hypothetical protein